MTPQEIIAEFAREEVQKVYNKTVVTDAFVVGYNMLRKCAIPKLGEQIAIAIDPKKPEAIIVTFRLDQLPELTFVHIKELSNLGFRADKDLNSIVYNV